MTAWDELKPVLARLEHGRLTGTASLAPRLGYTVPPGERGIQATLKFAPDLGGSFNRRTPVLPLTVTA